MNRLIIILLIGVVCIGGINAAPRPTKKAGGGCAGCVLALGLIEEIAVEKNMTDLRPLIHDICAETPFWLEWLCDDLLLRWAQQIQEDYSVGDTPDEQCRKIGMCDNPQCNLFKKANWPPNFGKHGLRIGNHNKIPLGNNLFYKEAGVKDAMSHEDIVKTSKMFGVDPLMLTAITKNGFKLQEYDGGLPVANHRPLDDFDGDGFSHSRTLRGYDWRGQDCDDNILSGADVYPGRKPDDDDVERDSNCNGIVGTDGRGEGYESVYCEDTESKGVVILGDSAAAHFNLPKAWITAKNASWSNYNDIAGVLADEVDWPHCSWATGWDADSNCPPIPSGEKKMHSIYQRMRERNLCNHRDYQNIGVNGARTSSMSEQIIQTMSRNQRKDKPVLAFYALIGNDVCSSRINYTPVDEFRQNVLDSFDYLEEHLPKGSTVVIIGLVDGRVLYNLLHDHIHPILVKYSEVYDFLNCLETNPCMGWLNSNETIRNETSEHAFKLNKVYNEIMDNHTYKNFDLVYTTTHIEHIIDKFHAEGKDPAVLISPADGFHPSQLGNNYLSENIWNFLEQYYPDALGPINPNNAQIKKRFGDQGGY